MNKNHKKVAEIYQALGNPVRIAIVSALEKREVAREDLLNKVGVPAPNFSQHLSRLRRANLVSLRRKDKKAYYRLSDPKVLMLRDTAREIYRRSSGE